MPLYFPRKTMKYFVLCQNPDEAQNIFSFNKSNMLVIPSGEPGMECDFVWGSNTAEFLNYWCAINATLLFLFNSYPGLGSNSRYGDFNDMKQRHSSCRIFSSRIASEKDQAFMELFAYHDNLPVLVSTDRNIAMGCSTIGFCYNCVV